MGCIIEHRYDIISHPLPHRLLLAVLIAAGCQPRPETAPAPASLPAATSAAPLPTQTPAATSTPTLIPSPTLPPTPTYTPTPALPVLAGTPLPDPRQPITQANLADLVELARWEDGEALAAAWWPDGTLLAVATELGLAVHRAPGLELLYRCPSPGGVQRLAFSPDGRLIAAAATVASDAGEIQLGEIQLWEAAGGRALHSLAPAGPVLGLAFTPDSAGLVVTHPGEGYATFRLATWQTADGRLQAERDLAGIQGEELLLSPDLTQAAVKHDGQVEFWDLAGPTRRGAFPYISNYTASAWAFSADGQSLAIGTNILAAPHRYYVELHRAADGGLVRKFDLPGMVGSVALSPDGSQVAAVVEAARVLLFAVANGAAAGELALATPGRILAFSPDGSQVAAGMLEIWQAAGAARVAQAAYGLITEVAFSPDGALLAYANGNEVKLRRVADGSLVHTLRGHTNYIERLAFAADGATLASASYDQTVRVWRVADGSELLALTGHRERITDLAISPDGSLIASASFDGQVRVERLADGKEILAWREAGLVRLAFSPGGELFVASQDGIQAWKLPEKKRLTRIAAGGSVQRLVFAPDGRKLLVITSRNARIIDAQTGIGEALIDLGPVYCHAAGYAPDGSLAALGCADGRVRVYAAGRMAELAQVGGAGYQFISGLAISPDGTLLAVDAGGTLRVWGVQPNR